MFKSNLSKEELLQIVSQEQIYSKYLKELPINKSIPCPYRKDITPSFSLFYASNGKLLFKDLAYNETGDCFLLVMKLFNLTFKEALKKIKQDVLSNNSFNALSCSKDLFQHTKRLHKSYNQEQTQITIQSKPFRKKEYQWWAEQGISDFTLHKFNVQVADRVYINSKLKIIGLVDNPVYFYTQNSRYRIYIPLNPKGRRWYGNMISTDIQGLEYIPDNCNSLVLIQKSYKDLMAISEQLGIYGVCKPGEGYRWLPEDILKLKTKSHNLVSNLDFDYCGITNANLLKRQYKIPYIFMSSSRSERRLDYTDTYKLYGKEHANAKIINLINQIKNHERYNK